MTTATTTTTTTSGEIPKYHEFHIGKLQSVDFVKYCKDYLNTNETPKGVAMVIIAMFTEFLNLAQRENTNHDLLRDTLVYMNVIERGVITIQQVIVNPEKYFAARRQTYQLGVNYAGSEYFTNSENMSRLKQGFCARIAPLLYWADSSVAKTIEAFSKMFLIAFFTDESGWKEVHKTKRKEWCTAAGLKIFNNLLSSSGASEHVEEMRAYDTLIDKTSQFLLFTYGQYIETIFKIHKPLEKLERGNCVKTAIKYMRCVQQSASGLSGHYTELLTKPFEPINFKTVSQVPVFGKHCEGITKVGEWNPSSTSTQLLRHEGDTKWESSILECMIAHIIFDDIGFGKNRTSDYHPVDVLLELIGYFSLYHGNEGYAEIADWVRKTLIVKTVPESVRPVSPDTKAKIYKILGTIDAFPVMCLKYPNVKSNRIRKLFGTLKSVLELYANEAPYEKIKNLLVECLGLTTEPVVSMPLSDKEEAVKTTRNFMKIVFNGIFNDFSTAIGLKNHEADAVVYMMMLEYAFAEKNEDKKEFSQFCSDGFYDAIRDRNFFEHMAEYITPEGSVLVYGDGVINFVQNIKGKKVTFQLPK